jgi:signal transduction histidine kinase
VTAADGDRRLLSRAALAVAVQSAVAVAVAVGVMAGGVLLVDRHARAVRIEQATKGVWRTADDVNDPPSGTWLVSVSPSGDRRTTVGAPGWLVGVDPTALPDGQRRVDLGVHQVVAWTGTRPSGRRLTAVLDVHPLDEQAERLRTSMAIAAALGVLGAAVAGGLIGRWAVRPLGQALTLQRRFVADVSHELRTPLTVLTTRAQVLRRHVGDGDLSVEADQLVRDARAMGDVVNDLLLSAELRHEPQRGECVDLGALADEVVESLRPLAAERGVDIARVGGPSADVRGVPSALRRALSSLADNAIAHTQRGGHVRVEVSAERELVRLAVTDDGEGLDPAEARVMVQRFARGTTRDSGRRFGLGLALVEEVATAHGGRLEIDGSPGAGASFALVLPQAGTQPPGDSQEQA